MGEIDDQRYDWNELNGGKGWESQVVRSVTTHFFDPADIAFHFQLAGAASAPGGSTPDRRREPDRGRRDEEQRRRASMQPGAQGPGAPVPPSPALVRHGSKSRRGTGGLMPGSPMAGGSIPSAAAGVGVPAASQNALLARRASAQQPGAPGAAALHPYASAAGTEYGAGVLPDDGAYSANGHGAYSHGAPAPPALTAVRARGGDVGAGGAYEQQMYDHEPPPPPLLVRILTCRC